MVKSPWCLDGHLKAVACDLSALTDGADWRALCGAVRTRLSSRNCSKPNQCVFWTASTVIGENHSGLATLFIGFSGARAREAERLYADGFLCWLAALNAHALQYFAHASVWMYQRKQFKGWNALHDWCVDRLELSFYHSIRTVSGRSSISTFLNS